MRRLMVLVVLCAFAFDGCYVPKPVQEPTWPKDPTLAELDQADYGVAPENPKEQALAHLKETLFDPMSAVVEWQGECVKGWWRWFKDKDPSKSHYIEVIYFGWTLVAKINAKNRMGGYVGFKTNTFCFRDGKLLRVI